MLPLFKSHYSIGKSILTLKDPSKCIENSSDSVFKIAVENKLDKIILVEDSLVGFFEAYRMSKQLGIQLIFGLRLSMRNSDQDEDVSSDHKIIIFSKNDEGCKLLNKIYSKAFTSFDGFLTYESLKEMWNEDCLKFAVPFYDSFIHVNNFGFGNTVPEINFFKPTFFLEDNGLALDPLLSDLVKDKANNVYNAPIEKVKSIYYKNKKDAEALMTYKIICNRSFGKARSLSRPELPHFCSDQFSFESWKEQND